MSGNENNIELELRSEVNDIELILSKLNSFGKLISQTNRLAVMNFGQINNMDFDIRIRITNGESEVVIKKGDFHSHNREEISQRICIEEFIGFVKIFASMDFHIKVGERISYNYDLGNNIIATLVKAGDTSYIEIEKMTNKQEEQAVRKELDIILNILELRPIESREKFDKLCNKINNGPSDWRFNGKEEDYEKLKSLLSNYVLLYKLQDNVLASQK
ncbi:MAG: hypothetical protein WCJ19_00515 [bacterium]